MPLRTVPTSTPSPAAAALSPEALAWGRVGIGASMVLRPRALPRVMGLDSATAARTGWAVQMLGVRDLALGVGTALSLRSADRRAARTWLTLGLVCDAVDALAIAGAAAKGRVSRTGAAVGVGLAVAAVAAGARALQPDETGI